MKNKNTIRAILSLSFLLFAACKIEPIFYAIEKEVPLEKAIIKGNLYAMTEFDGKLYAASGSLYEKNINEERGWKAVSAPGFIIRVASDESNLYVLTKDKKLYTKTKTTGWSQITGISPVELFDNKASGENKKAYVTTSGEEGTLYSLDGENTPDTPNEATPEEASNGASKSSKAAVHDGTKTIFSNTVLIASGENAVYTMEGNKIVFDGTDSDIEVSGAKSMAVYKESLLIGTTSGIVLVNLDNDGEPTAKGTMFGGNVESSIAMLEIKTLYSFGDAIYAFAVDKTTSKKTNTWGYYKDRPNWNVE